MPLYRLQVAAERGADLAIDDAVNTIYLQDIGPTSNPLALATDAANLWRANRSWPTGTTGIEAKIYDMADPEPRVPKARFRSAAPAVSPGGPREVALCLSFFATSNVPRRRGRIYLGPFPSGYTSYERPTTTVTDPAVALAAGIGNLGGVDVDWMQFSPTTGLANKVTNWWVDDEWDTVRSRGLKPITRRSGTTQE